MSNVAQVLGRLRNLPSKPSVVQKLDDIINDDVVSSKQVAKIVETDPALVARLLRLVNSPFYGFPREITSVEEAITILGFESVHQVLLAASLLTTLQVSPLVLDTGGFWRHSFGVGVIARRLLQSGHREAAGEAFMAGVLHDIGRLALAISDTAMFLAFRSDRKGLVTIESETSFFGLNHQEAGELLARNWNFPDAVTVAIANHHTPDKAPAKHLRLTATVWMADVLVHALGIGNSTNEYVAEFFPDIWHSLDLTDSDLRDILKESLAEIQSMGRILTDS